MRFLLFLVTPVWLAGAAFETNTTSDWVIGQISLGYGNIIIHNAASAPIIYFIVRFNNYLC